jgi:hypothetical protein
MGQRLAIDLIGSSTPQRVETLGLVSLNLVLHKLHDIRALYKAV